MGQAKQRGTFEQRKRQALIVQAAKDYAEKEQSDELYSCDWPTCGCDGVNTPSCQAEFYNQRNEK